MRAPTISWVVLDSGLESGLCGHPECKYKGGLGCVYSEVPFSRVHISATPCSDFGFRASAFHYACGRERWDAGTLNPKPLQPPLWSFGCSLEPPRGARARRLRLCPSQQRPPSCSCAGGWHNNVKSQTLTHRGFFRDLASSVMRWLIKP